MEKWWAMQGSNLRHPPCKGGALPAELIARINLSEINKGLLACQFIKINALY